jgi:hypothetical protein
MSTKSARSLISSTGLSSTATANSITSSKVNEVESASSTIVES